MKNEEIKEKVKKKLNIIDRLQKYAVRTCWQLLVHVLVAIVLAILVYFFWGRFFIMGANSFTVIASSMSAASGVLLAVSITLANFFSRHVTDWRDRLIQKLREDRERLGVQIEKSAGLHSDISRHLADLYMKSVFYIPGQAVDMGKMDSAIKIFRDWARERIEKGGNKFGFGDIYTYDSFEKHLFDAHLYSKELYMTLAELHIAEISGRTINTFSPLIITYVIIAILALVFAIAGGIYVIPTNLNFPLLIIPFYLLLLAIFALTKDITAILRHMRVLESGVEEATAELSDKLKGQIK